MIVDPSTLELYERGDPHLAKDDADTLLRRKRDDRFGHFSLEHEAIAFFSNTPAVLPLAASDFGRRNGFMITCDLSGRYWHFAYERNQSEVWMEVEGDEYATRDYADVPLRIRAAVHLMLRQIEQDHMVIATNMSRKVYSHETDALPASLRVPYRSRQATLAFNKLRSVYKARKRMVYSRHYGIDEHDDCPVLTPAMSVDFQYFSILRELEEEDRQERAKMGQRMGVYTS